MPSLIEEALSSCVLTELCSVLGSCTADVWVLLTIPCHQSTVNLDLICGRHQSKSPKKHKSDKHGRSPEKKRKDDRKENDRKRDRSDSHHKSPHKSPKKHKSRH